MKQHEMISILRSNWIAYQVSSAKLPFFIVSSHTRPEDSQQQIPSEKGSAMQYRTHHRSDSNLPAIDLQHGVQQMNPWINFAFSAFLGEVQAEQSHKCYTGLAGDVIKYFARGDDGGS